MGKVVKSQWDFGELFTEQALRPEAPAPPVAPTRPSPPEKPPQAPAVLDSPIPPVQPQQRRKILSVSELTWQVKRVLEGQLRQVWVSGEITNLKTQSSGHAYFTLKDAGAQLSCVLFRGELQVDRSLLQDGRKVALLGDVTVYEARGQYQLRVIRVEAEGLGALQAAFE